MTLPAPTADELDWRAMTPPLGHIQSGRYALHDTGGGKLVIFSVSCLPTGEWMAQMMGPRIAGRDATSKWDNEADAEQCVLDWIDLMEETNQRTTGTGFLGECDGRLGRKNEGQGDAIY